MRLLQEAPRQLGAAAMVFQQHFDGYVPADVGVAPPQDRAHAAARNLLQKL